MKNSKVLRGICYILLPILVAVVILSSFYVVAINEKSFTSKEQFFSGRNFKSSYLGRISYLMDELIFAEGGYLTVQDGINTIYYTNPYPIYGIDDCGEFLIIYKNKALTNISIRDENTNTIEEIKNYIASKRADNQVNLNYENKEFNSNEKDFVDDYLENYLYSKQITYYTNNKTNEVTKYDTRRDDIYDNIDVGSSYYDENGNLIMVGEYYYDEEGVLRLARTGEEILEEVDETPEIEEIPVIPYSSSNSVVTPIEPEITTPQTSSVSKALTSTEDEKENIEYHTATLEDFTFYTSFNKELKGASDISLVIETMETLKPYEQEITIAMPVSGILTLIICIFLINSIGHEKGKDEVELSDFDKIPLEIIYIVIGMIIALLFVIMSETFVDIASTKDTFFTFVATVYAISSILIEVGLVTTITRLKAKKFLDTCICGKLFKLTVIVCSKILDVIKSWISKFWKGVKRVKKGISDNVKLTLKVILLICTFVIIAIFLLIGFGGFGIILDGFLLFFVIYWVIFRVESFVKLEAGLKEIYEGNNKVRLYKDDFSKEFENCIDYVNDISNGFENAVEESLKSERLKTELITNVSHDIKTPLTSIINYVDLIKKENIDNEKLKEYVDILDNKSQRLKKLTEDLVEASKASSGNVSLNLEEIGLIELLNQLIGEYKDKFEEKKLEVVTNLSKVNLKIKADSRYLYRVIDNLFGNISKYALDGSRVYVETEIVDGGKVKVILKNISKDKLNISEEELMQRFVRGDKSRTTEGSGLGLAIARSLTELQKGTLNCKIDGDLFKVEVEFDII